jgi:hypothetical protein
MASSSSSASATIAVGEEDWENMSLLAMGLQLRAMRPAAKPKAKARWRLVRPGVVGSKKPRAGSKQAIILSKDTIIAGLKAEIADLQEQLASSRLAQAVIRKKGVEVAVAGLTSNRVMWVRIR